MLYTLKRVLVGAVLLGAAIPGGAQSQTPAFPGAEGAGMYTVGGRHGTVYRVTNLNASGPGSLADAVSQSNRIVIFTVSGIIDLASKGGKSGKITISEPNITVAGQTAPGEGICLKNGSLEVEAGEVILRHLRSRRGFVAEGNSGDAIGVKPVSTKAESTGEGTTKQAFDKKLIKKNERGRDTKEPSLIQNIIIDHCSTSWATDENLTLTHPNFTTAQYCIAAEGLDYANPKQTPPNHSEGSLWGVTVPDGRSTMHHMLYAHNRLRNPRTTGGHLPPAVLQFCNSVVYDCSEYYSHTGSEAVHLNWLDNYYKYGPSTAAELRGQMFQFNKTPLSRMFASGNHIDGFPDRSADNWKAVVFNKNIPDLDKKAMCVEKPFDTFPVKRQTAQEAYETVLADAGATLPARDAVDLRIVTQVRTGAGRIIGKETDLPADQRWPDYRSLAAPVDRDADGIPDYWEGQFGLKELNAADGTAITAGGYANVEHYFNNTDPLGGSMPLVYVSGEVSRALAGAGQAGALKVTRTGNLEKALMVAYTVGGTAVAGGDFKPLTGTVTIPAGAASVRIPVAPTATAGDNKTVVVSVNADNASYHVGCPAAALVVIRK
jgi:hypothetical protein